MAYEHLSRRERRAMSIFAREEAAKRPAKLTPIPYIRWPVSYKNNPEAPTQAWESRKYLCQLYDVTPFQGIDTRRLSICRVTLQNDGMWEANLEWDELMEAKRQCGFGDWYAMEIYPRERDIVNVANMRHLWLLAVPLSIGWFAPSEEGQHGQ